MPKVIYRGGPDGERTVEAKKGQNLLEICLLYTSDAADEL